MASTSSLSAGSPPPSVQMKSCFFLNEGNLDPVEVLSEVEDIAMDVESPGVEPASSPVRIRFDDEAPASVELRALRFSTSALVDVHTCQAGKESGGSWTGLVILKKIPNNSIASEISCRSSCPFTTSDKFLEQFPRFVMVRNRLILVWLTRSNPQCPRIVSEAG